MTAPKKKSTELAGSRGSKQFSKNAGGKFARHGTSFGAYGGPNFGLYESLKAAYTAEAASQAEYDAGIRRAVRESGV
jgi:hypothetical protein